MNEWETWLDSRLGEIQDVGRWRTLRPLARGRDSIHVRDGDRDLILFSGNDYLGLSCHPAVVSAAQDALAEWGIGPRGSALVCGHTEVHERLQVELAALKHAEKALLTPSGFAANLAVIQSLAGEGVEFFSDELNHASIIDGLRSAKRAGAKVSVYGHLDMGDLKAQLGQSSAARKVVVTDGVFSMDGDLADLRALAKLKKELHFLLVVDDAHGTLVFKNGGLAGEQGLPDVVDIHVGTLSKAFGSQGGFVASSAGFVNLLTNIGRTFIFSTALPVATVAGALAAIQVVEREPAIRQALWEHVHHVSDVLERTFESPILPIVIGTEADTMKAAEMLRASGLHVIGIRPPTVPEGTGRLRITLSSLHSESEVDHLLTTLVESIL